MCILVSWQTLDAPLFRYLPLVRPKGPGCMHGGMNGRLTEKRTSVALKHRVCCHFDDAEQGLKQSTHPTGG